MENREGREMMETEVQRLLDALADLRDKADVNVVFGEPVAVEGRTVIPVASVAYGFGMGVGHDTVAEAGATEEVPEEEAEEAGGGAGGGGGVLARPLAVIEVTPEGTQVQPIVDEQKVALAGGLLAGWAVFWLARTLVKIFGRRA
jgi:uncharacterized spore protein YtfJ